MFICHYHQRFINLSGLVPLFVVWLESVECPLGSFGISKGMTMIQNTVTVVLSLSSVCILEKSIH